MEQNTAKVISQIAEIQLEALKKLKKDPSQIAKEYLMKLLEASESEIVEAIDNHIQIYEDMRECPELIKMLTEYQTTLCSYILWRMEDDWITSFRDGIAGAWAVITDAQCKFHPEYRIIL